MGRLKRQDQETATRKQLVETLQSAVRLNNLQKIHIGSLEHQLADAGIKPDPRYLAEKNKKAQKYIDEKKEITQ